MSKIQSFLERKKLKFSLKLYFVDVLGAMALGLFATLLIGTIFGTIGEQFKLAFLTEVAAFAKNGAVVGAAIAVAMGMKLSAPPLVMLSASVVGAMSYSLGATVSDGIAYTAGPAGVFFAVLVACEVGKLVSGETKVDILVTPTVTILVGYGLSKLLCPIIAYAMYYLGDFIATATEYQPLLMGIVLAVVVGMILTLPISSAAICAMIGIGGIAGGAAAVGCCCQMVGFAVTSFRENRWGGLVAQGLGTSMLQMGNIVRKPQIWLAPTLAAAVCGPLSTMIFRLECVGVSAGMGTCGLVSPLGILTASGYSANVWIGILLCCIVLPAVLSLVFDWIFRKIGWVKLGDMQLNL